MLGRLGLLAVGAESVNQPLTTKSDVGPITYPQEMMDMQPLSFINAGQSTSSAPSGASAVEAIAQGQDKPYTYSGPGEETEYQQAYASGAQLSPADRQIAASYGITAPASAVRTISPPMFKANLLQPLQPTGFTAQQQQSLDPAAYAQQQAALAAQRAAQAAPKSNKTLYIVGGAVVGLALLYFMFKGKR